MFPNPIELAFARFQARRDPRALAFVFDRTAAELLRVAQHLASTEATAEDLVQSTFVVAIQAADEHRRGEPVLPWLLGILTNQARSARRRSRRQPDRTRIRREGLADVETDVERNELGAVMQSAIARLPEVYRPVLRLWLELGLEAQEIARALDRPAGTVRAQISRGLEQLRRALPSGITAGVAVAAVTGRGLAAVRSAVLAECPGTSIGIGSTLVLGGLLVLHHKGIALGAAAALVLATWGLTAPGPSSEPMAAESAGPGPAPVVASLDAATESTPAPRVAIRAATEAEAPATKEPAAVAEGTGVLVVALVGEDDGRPLAGIGVAAQLAHDRNSFTRHAQWIRSDAIGRVRFDGLPPGPVLLDVDRLGSIASAEVVAGQMVQTRIEVPRGVRVDGRVVDELERPVAGAIVLVQGSRFAAPEIARSDANGRFVAEALNPGLHLQARKAGHVASRIQAVEGKPGSEVTAVLRVATEGRRVRGRALTDDGGPLVGATIAIVDAAGVQQSFWDRTEAQRRPLYLATGSDGSFATDEASSETQLVLVQPTEGEHAPCWQIVEAGASEAFVELRAPRAAVLAGRVAGADTAGIVVQAASFDHEALGFLVNLVGMRTATVGADGTYRLDGLPSGRVSIAVRRMFTTLAEGERTLAAGETATFDVELAALAAKVPFTVRVHAAEPLPVGAVVMLWPHSVESSTPAMAVLDAEGKAVFDRGVDAAVDVAVCLLPGRRSMMQLARRQDVPPAEPMVEFALTPGQWPRRTITGRLVDAMGAPKRDEAVLVMRSQADGLVGRIETTTDADGRFTTPALPAGSYSVRVGTLETAEGEIRSAVVTVDRDEDLGTIAVR